MFTEQDKVLIEELNLQQLPEDRQAAALQRFYNALQLKFGMALEEKLSDEQLAEFEKVSEAGNNEQIVAWLQQAVPDYDQVMAAEMVTLKQEIKQNAADFRDIVNEGTS